MNKNLDLSIELRSSWHFSNCFLYFSNSLNLLQCFRSVSKSACHFLVKKSTFGPMISP